MTGKNTGRATSVRFRRHDRFCTSGPSTGSLRWLFEASRSCSRARSLGKRSSEKFGDAVTEYIQRGCPRRLRDSMRWPSGFSTRGQLAMKRVFLSSLIASLGWVLALYSQGGSEPRRILFDSFEPIASRIIAGEQRIVVVSAKGRPDVAHPDDGSFVATIVRDNPIIFAGRIVQKQPVFLRLRAGQNALEVSMTEANWVGSRITVMVDRIIQTADELPLTILQRLTFTEEGDGTATINGVRVDTETPWLEPLQQGRRYLISGRIKGGAFSSTGMWMEPADGGNLRPRFRDSTSPYTTADPPLFRAPKTPFVAWTIDEASDRLQAEVQRRNALRQ
jgi:hypothetical protein